MRGNKFNIIFILLFIISLFFVYKLNICNKNHSAVSGLLDNNMTESNHLVNKINKIQSDILVKNLKRIQTNEGFSNKHLGNNKQIKCHDGVTRNCPHGSRDCYDYSKTICEQESPQSENHYTLGEMNIIKCPDGTTRKCHQGTRECHDHSIYLCKQPNTHPPSIIDYGNKQTIHCRDGTKRECTAGSRGCYDNSELHCNTQVSESEDNLRLIQCHRNKKIYCDPNDSHCHDYSYKYCESNNDHFKTIRCPDGSLIRCNQNDINCVDNSKQYCDYTQNHHRKIKCNNGVSVICPPESEDCVSTNLRYCPPKHGKIYSRPNQDIVSNNIHQGSYQQPQYNYINTKSKPYHSDSSTNVYYPEVENESESETETEEEQRFGSNGNNNIYVYNNTKIPNKHTHIEYPPTVTHVPTTHVPTTHVPTTQFSTTHVPTTHVPMIHTTVTRPPVTNYSSFPSEEENRYYNSPYKNNYEDALKTVCGRYKNTICRYN